MGSGGGGGGYSGQSGICRQCPVSQKFTFHWWTHAPQFMASNNLFIWTNSQIGALMLTPGVSVVAVSVYNDPRVLNIGSGITVITP